MFYIPSCKSIWKKGGKFFESLLQTIAVIVNDKAERRVKLIADYATILTDNHKQRTTTIKAVERPRQENLDLKKFPY